MYNYELAPHLQEILKRLWKKDISTYEQVMKKINEVISSGDVEHYKNLRHSLKEFKRVQIGPFVLTFKFDKTTNTIKFEDFDHHDKIYEKERR